MVRPTTSVSDQVQQWGIPLPPRIREISGKMKIIRFGTIQETAPNPWKRLAGMFHLDRPLNIEEMLDARGFEESADYV
jgi:hypothetical protein